LPVAGCLLECYRCRKNAGGFNPDKDPPIPGKISLNLKISASKGNQSAVKACKGGKSRLFQEVLICISTNSNANNHNVVIKVPINRGL